MTGRPDGVVGAGLILLAAGQGTRLGAGRPKALVPLGRGADAAPILVHALRGALRCSEITDLVVVAPPDRAAFAEVEQALAPVLADVPQGVGIQVVTGGAERPDSVARGLRALPAHVGVVLVHDAARALTPVEVFDRVVHAVHSGHPAVTPAVAVADTIKQVRTGPTGLQTVLATLDRASLRAVQTPQGFLRETLERAHAEPVGPHAGTPHAGTPGAAAPRAAQTTDDCGMVEARGGRVTVVEGSPRALKITTPQDLEVAAAWIDAEHGPAPEARTAPLLVVLSGRPGVGKTTLARLLASRTGATHLRGDSIEQALVSCGLEDSDQGPYGYAACYAIARDQLRLRRPVVADMVNGLDLVRQEWEDVGRGCGASVLRVLVECRDEDEHRRRVETRIPDIPGHRAPGWEETRTREMEPWPQADLTVDTSSGDLQPVVEAIVRRWERSRP